MITETTVDEDGAQHETARYFQSPEGRMLLNPVDTDARWGTTRAGKASGLQYQENVIVDRGGFILSRGVTHALEREFKAVAALIEKLPLQPVSLAGEAGTAMGDCGNCWRNGTSRPTFPSTRETRPAWFPPWNSSTVATTWCARRAKSWPGQFPQTKPHLPVRGAPEGLSGLSRQGDLPSAKAETAVLHPDDVLSRVLEGQGTEPN